MDKAGKKTGGRKSGVKNKNRAELRALINKELRGRHLLERYEEWCPIAMMAVIAQKAFNSGDNYLALAAARECAKYVQAPLQAVRPEGSDDGPEPPDMTGVTERFFQLSGAGKLLLEAPEVIELTPQITHVRDLIQKPIEDQDVQ